MISVVINPAAGQDEPVLAKLNRVFDQQGQKWQPLITLAEGDDARTLANRALDEGSRVVAAYGGDGTISAVAEALVGTDVPLAILPGGTGNVIAQDLGIPLELEEAAALACDEGAPRAKMDTIQQGQHSRLLRIGVGADALVIRRAEREAKDRLGWLAYLMGALEQLREPPVAHYTVTIDGQRLEALGVTCVVANIGRLGRGGVSLSSGIDPFDGLLDVLFVRDNNLEAWTSIGAGLIGVENVVQSVQDVGDAAFAHLQGRCVEVETSPRQPMHADGELIPEESLSVRVQPKSLRVVLPRGARLT